MKVQHTAALTNVTKADAANAIRSTALEGAYRQVLAGARGAPFSDETDNMLNGVWLTSDGVAIVEFADIRGRVPNVTTSYGVRLMMSKLNGAGFADPAVSAIEYRLDGSCGEFWNWVEADCNLVRR